MTIELMKQALEALESATPKYTRQRADQKTLGGALDYWKLEQHQRLKAITSLRQAIAEAEKQEPPPECQTDAEKTAYAFGWWKAMEAQRANKHSATHRKPLTITNEMAFAFHRVLSDGSISKDETEEIKRGLESAFAHMITHQYVPTQKEGETFSVEYYEIDTQPKREWVGLTDEEIEQGCKESWVTLQAWQSVVWWAEAKLKEKNT